MAKKFTNSSATALTPAGGLALRNIMSGAVESLGVDTLKLSALGPLSGLCPKGLKAQTAALFLIMTRFPEIEWGQNSELYAKLKASGKIDEADKAREALIAKYTPAPGTKVSGSRKDHHNPFYQLRDLIDATEEEVIPVLASLPVSELTSTEHVKQEEVIAGLQNAVAVVRSRFPEIDWTVTPKADKVDIDLRPEAHEALTKHLAELGASVDADSLRSVPVQSGQMAWGHVDREIEGRDYDVDLRVRLTPEGLTCVGGIDSSVFGGEENSQELIRKIALYIKDTLLPEYDRAKGKTTKH